MSGMHKVWLQHVSKKVKLFCGGEIVIGFGSISNMNVEVYEVYSATTDEVIACLTREFADEQTDIISKACIWLNKNQIIELLDKKWCWL